MCPEVSFERFGWFASQLIGYHDEVERDESLQRLVAELAAEKAVDVDLVNIEDNPNWKWGWKSVAPRHYTECALYAPLMIGVQEIVGERKHPGFQCHPTGTGWGTFKLNYYLLFLKRPGA